MEGSPGLQMEMEGSNTTSTPVESPRHLINVGSEPGSAHDFTQEDTLASVAVEEENEETKRQASSVDVIWIGIIEMYNRMHSVQKFTFVVEMLDVISDFVFWFATDADPGLAFLVLVFATIGLILQAIKLLSMRRALMREDDLWDMTQQNIYIGYIILLLEDLPQTVLVILISDGSYDSIAQFTLVLSILNIMWKIAQHCLLKLECLMVDNTDKQRGWTKHATKPNKRGPETPRDHEDGMGETPGDMFTAAVPIETTRSGEDITQLSILTDHMYNLSKDYKIADKTTTTIIAFCGDIDTCITEEMEREWSQERSRMQCKKEIELDLQMEEEAADDTGPYNNLFRGLNLLLSHDGPVKVSSLNGKHVALYFGGCWCPHCIHYCPKLINAYNAVKAAGHDFEIVYISSDRSEVAFDGYFAKHPWLAVPYVTQDVRRRLDAKFQIEGVPSVVLLDGEAKLYEKDGRNKILEPEKFPWDQLPPLVQVLIDTTGCDRDLAERALRAAFGNPDRAFEYVSNALSAPDIKEGIVEVVNAFASDYSNPNYPLKVGDRLSVLKADEVGDIAIMHLTQGWGRPGWIAKWHFQNIRVVSAEELKAEDEAAEKELEEQRLRDMDINDDENLADDPDKSLMKKNKSVTFDPEQMKRADSLDIKVKPLLKKRSTTVGSVVDMEELVIVLMDAMGTEFPEEKARQALADCDGDMEEALEMLLSFEAKSNQVVRAVTDPSHCHPDFLLSKILVPKILIHTRNLGYKIAY